MEELGYDLRRFKQNPEVQRWVNQCNALPLMGIELPTYECVLDRSKAGKPVSDQLWQLVFTKLFHQPIKLKKSFKDEAISKVI